MNTRTTGPAVCETSRQQKGHHSARLRWVQGAERVTSGDTRILGEGELGQLLVPVRGEPGCWDRRFNPANPAHWAYWIRSRLTKRIANLEPA